MATKPSHSTTLDCLGNKKKKVSVPMSAKDYETCTPLLQQLLRVKKIDSHVYDEASSTVHVSRSTQAATEKKFGDVYSERVLEIPMSGEEYETCTTSTGLLRQISFAGLIHAYMYAEETKAAYLYYKIRVEGGSLAGKGQNAKADDLEGVQ